ncbi:MAG: hypothetical protein HOQ22_16610 [Nocardioidaceae bacterium]|nr:hypothetical protein [Nocardioidaceae bacterium]NUS52647.1 hypothetical protein [Nocardioidaceae bacterium]
MTQPARRSSLVLLLVLLVLAAGCDSGSPEADPGRSASTGTREPSAGQTVEEDPLVTGLDVCSLVRPTQVRRAAGQIGEPTYRALSRLPGYAGITDQCGFGVSFDSYTLTVDVGMLPASPQVVKRLPLKPVKGVSVAGLGDAALATESDSYSAVYFVKGRTFVRLQAFKREDPSRMRDLVGVARQVAEKVPTDPPDSDEETSGGCARLDPAAVRGVLGAEPGLSRSFPYKDNSSVCSFASGVGSDAKFVAVATYTNPSAGPFLADQEQFLPSKPVSGIPGGHAFTVPGTAYFIGDDGQAIGVTGSLGGDPKVPARPTPALVGLVTSAAGLLQ